MSSDRTEEKRGKFNGASKWHGNRDLRAIDECRQRSIYRRIDAFATGHYYRGPNIRELLHHSPPSVLLFYYSCPVARTYRGRGTHTHADPHDRHNSPRNPRQPVLPSVVTQFRNAWTPFSAVSHYNTVYLSSIAQSQYIIIPPAILRENPTAFVHAGRLETEKCEAVRRKQ